MKKFRPVPHYEQVNTSAIESKFSTDRLHRAKLHIPFLGNRGSKTLCVIGQNPSAADELYADKTVRYLEELIYRKNPEYASVLVLNLYSRIDTTKSETEDTLDSECSRIFFAAIEEHDDFLIFYGKIENQGAYRFRDRAREVASSLGTKNVLKLGLDTSYAPHPGNPRILYHNFDIQLTTHEFSDL